MLAIFNYLNAHYLPIFQSISMILVSKFMVYRALSDKTYLLLGLLSPLTFLDIIYIFFFFLQEILKCLIHNLPLRHATAQTTPLRNH